MVVVPVPPSEVVDRLTILDLKALRARQPSALAHAAGWRAALERAWEAAGLPSPRDLPEHDALAEVNAALWDVEDRLRQREADGDFGPAFVQDARSVYTLNDRRAALKGAIDRRLGAEISDPKSYGADNF